MDSKPWYLSKTIILNLIVGLCASLAVVVPSLKSVSDWISSNASILGMFWAAANVALRFITKDKIGLSD